MTKNDYPGLSLTPTNLERREEPKELVNKLAFAEVKMKRLLN